MIVTAPADAGDDDPWTTLLARVPDTARYREFLVLSDDFAWDGERLHVQRITPVGRGGGSRCR